MKCLSGVDVFARNLWIIFQTVFVLVDELSLFT